MTRFEVGLNNYDVNNAIVDYSAFIAQMEALSSDGYTHALMPDSLEKAGVLESQFPVYWWSIQEATLTTAQSDFNTAIAGHTYTIQPYAYSWSIA